MTMRAAPSPDARPLVAHVVFRFDVGGLENGVVNLVNRLPRERFRHVIVSLTEITDFRARVERDDVRFVALHKKPGHGVRIYPALYRLFRALRPAIVHTRNLAALEASVPAALAGVPVRIHGEHGRDVGDLDGSSRPHRRMRRLYRPFVQHYVALSRDLERYLAEAVGVPRARISQIYNGVDVDAFAPAGAAALRAPDCPFRAPDTFVVGTVGRLAAVKDQVTLARAFVRAARCDAGARLRLVIAGAGELRGAVEDVLRAAGMVERAWLPGARADVPAILRSLDLFVLPSLGEGISNTILEAMATGLPVVATHVGGNPELVDDGVTGALVPAAAPDAMAAVIARYAADAPRAQAHGRAGRERVLQRFSVERMVQDYQALYERLCATPRASVAAPSPQQLPARVR
jgi:sugar transferase (PEP-CTERM/EpsH1 system associated)